MQSLASLLQNIMRTILLFLCSCVFLCMADLSAKQELPLVGVDRLLKEAKEKHGARVTMVLRQHENQEDGLAADCRLVAPARWDLLERIKFLTVKKRGPRRGWKAREEELCGK